MVTLFYTKIHSEFFIFLGVALHYTIHLIEKIEYNPKNEEYVLDLMIHMGCMLDRCLSKIDIKYNNLDLYKEKEKLLFDKIIIALKDIEQDYNIKISDDEVAYIVKIITTKK